VVSYSVVDEGNDNGLYGDETRQMVERVNARVLGDATNHVAFGVNAPLGCLGVL